MLAHDLIYIINLFPSSGSVAIYAQRNCYGSPGYFQVPASYYSIDLNYSYGGQNVTAIFMIMKLSEQDDSGWSDNLLVSLTSTLSENTATQIKWILDTYSTLSTNAASFTAVANQISNLPSHWALFDQPDALALAEDMAWQARCALYVKNNTVYIKYLGAMTADSEISMNEVKLKSLELSFTPTEDIVTKFKAQYFTDYSGDKASDKEHIYTRNTDKFGTVAEEYNYTIYTNVECIKASARFWGYRYLTSWRRMSLTAFLPTLHLEAFDWVTINLPTFSTYSLPANVLVSDRDTETHEIDFELEIASSAGTHIGGQPSLDSGYYDSTGSIPAIGIPDSSITLLSVCNPIVDGETITNIRNEIGAACIKARSIGGVGLKYDVCEIVGMDQDGYTHVDVPSANNLPPDKIVFIKDHFLNSIGCVYSAAGTPQWCQEDLSGGDPNWGSGFVKIGDSVGTVKGKTSLSKQMSGFLVVGKDGEIAVTNSQIEQPIKIKSDESIGAGVFVEAKSTENGITIVGKPSENSMAPARLIITLASLEPGEEGYGKNAFDASPFVDGEADPENPNCEMGTVANTFEVSYKDSEGNPLTGFIRILGEEGKHQVRPF